MCLVPPFRHSISTRSFFPHPWRDHTGCRPARLMGMAILDLRSCRKRSRGQAKLVCREVHRRRERACRRGAATLRRIRNLSLDPCPAIRKNSICKRRPRRVETRRIRTGTHPRTRVNMVAVGANHDNMRFFEVIDERVQVCERLPQHMKFEHCRTPCVGDVKFQLSMKRTQTHEITFKGGCRVSVPIHHVAR